MSGPDEHDTDCMPPEGQEGLEGNRGRAAVAGNERLTATAGTAILVLVALVLATLPSLHALLSVHVLIGVMLAGPLAVKLGSTGYRFIRYYAGSPAFVRKGRPPQALRFLAPLLIASTLVLIGSGFGLLLLGPDRMRGLLVALHVLSFVVWLPTIVLHAVAHVPQVPKLVGEDWRRRGSPPAGRGVRASLMLASLLAGGVAGVLLLGSAVPWTSQAADAGKFLLVAVVIAGLTAAVVRPWRWK